MREKLSDPASLKDLTDAAGCTPRTLQRLFRTYRGHSPLGVLCHMRLAAAHSALATHSPRCSAVHLPIGF